MFQTLRKSEQITVLEDALNIENTFSDSEVYSGILRAVLQELSPIEFNRVFEKCLHNRKVANPNLLSSEIFTPIIPELAQINPTKLQTKRVANWLESEVA